MNFYGILITLGLLLAGFILEQKKSKFFAYYFDKKQANKLSSIFSFDLVLPWLLIPAVVGARIYHLLDYWDYYQHSPMRIFKIWQGGLGIYGALAGGLVGLFVYKIVNDLQKKELLVFLDLIVFVLPLGQAVGRLGNYFNNEVYGFPTDLPWGIYIPQEKRIVYLEESYFHPLFAYELLWSFLIFVIFLLILKYFIVPKAANDQQVFPGDFFFAYLFLYPLGRFCLDFLRIRSWWIDLGVISIRMSQLISLSLMLTSFIYLSFLRKDSFIASK
jgi:phosphatidylglycerol:prolipoprotein diacylglycerol transferase